MIFLTISEQRAVGIMGFRNIAMEPWSGNSRVTADSTAVCFKQIKCGTSLNTYKDVPHFICLKQQQYCQISCHSAITRPRFHGNVPKAHFSDSPLFRNCEYSNVNHYCPHAHPN